MKKFRWQLLIILLTGLIVGVLLIIQQMDDNEQIMSTPSPISGGVYTEAIVGEFMRLNPLLDIYNDADKAVDQLIFSSLIHFDSQGIPQAELADTWGVSKDGTVYNLSLRPDVYWHDGENFDTRDVVFTINLMKSQHGLIPEDLRNFWAEVEVVALSDLQMQFLLPETFSPFLDYLTFGILPEHILSGVGMEEMVDHPFNLAPVGTGPFKFQRMLIENNEIVGVVLEAFDNYFLEGPFIDEFNFRYYPTSEAALAAYEQGEVEGFGEVHESILPQVLTQSDLAIFTARKPILTMVYLNLENPEIGFIDNPDFRRAMMEAINRNKIIEQAYYGQAVPANGPIAPGTWAYYSELEVVDHDPVNAKSLFDSTGAVFDEEQSLFTTAEGLPIEITLLHPDTQIHTTIAELIKSDWEQLGIEVTLDSQPYEGVLLALEERNYQAALVEINLSESPDPDPYPFWAQAQMKSGQNFAEWDNRSASEFLEQARMTVDQAERIRLYRNFQVLFMREMPSLPLFFPVYTYAISEDVKGISIGPILEPSDRFKNVHEWYILAALESSPSQTNEATNIPEE
jgi:peptide/nickel transport system substrate-binding protein